MAKPNPTPPTLSEKHINRFWRSVDQSEGQGPNGDCWEWKGCVTDKGYGNISINTRDIIVSRLSFFLATGIWSLINVCHTCDNPPCCNPSHLFEGTTRDNALDAKRKGRLAVGDRCGARKYPERISQGIKRYQQLNPELAHRGENHRSAKLTEQDVIYIRASYIPKHGWFSMIARKYGVSSKTIAMIVHREIWTHI